MGKKNKPVFNGYACFMNDFQKKSGQKFNSKKDLAEAAASHWAKLTQQQQQVYKDKAKGLKGEAARYTSQGVNVDIILAEENRKKLIEQEMNNYINSLMISLSESNEFPFQMFHLISINEFCFFNGNKRFIPAEIAVIKFNLQDGVIADNVFHYIIKPGKLPLGYTADATKISNETHQLPVPLGIDKSEDNRHEVTEGLLKFLRAGISTVERDFPPLFCEDKYREKVQNVVKYLLIDQGYSEDLIKIYSLDSFFYQLRNTTADGEIIWPSITLSTLELERDVYDYCPGIACDFHDNSDVPNFYRLVVMSQ
ncbi:protein maelstrom homolog [Agrilus planipennis]|uniref:Protein maelstrom homolog n=1 Tax=Agrilus planipennis TaxID=224129 RepID=A0A7F5RGA2_AGRPL|nr:protein maelstrom homolog [Agrilus planipennis]